MSERSRSDSRPSRPAITSSAKSWRPMSDSARASIISRGTRISLLRRYGSRAAPLAPCPACGSSDKSPQAASPPAPAAPCRRLSTWYCNSSAPWSSRSTETSRSASLRIYGATMFLPKPLKKISILVEKVPWVAAQYVRAASHVPTGMGRHRSTSRRRHRAARSAVIRRSRFRGPSPAL